MEISCHADVFGKTDGLSTIGLRNLNALSPRRDQNGAYAAVVPKWFATRIAGDPVYH